jgi:hypothetical protein
MFETPKCRVGGKPTKTATVAINVDFYLFALMVRFTKFAPNTVRDNVLRIRLNALYKNTFQTDVKKSR